MKRFFTLKFLTVTFGEVLALVLVYFDRAEHHIPSGLLVALAMGPFYLVIDQVKSAAPSWQKPPDDGTYSIAGAGLEAVKEANANRTDWAAVTFYSLYAVAVVLIWVVYARSVR